MIGRGHFATVYTCTDKITGDQYAVKVFERFSGDRMKIKRKHMEFVRYEVKLMSTLQHPNITCVRDMIAEDEHIFIVMDLAKGGELFNRIVHRTRFTEPEIRKLFSQLFSALKYLHDQNIVHRDVKPENIFCMDDGLSITLGDFGLATYVSPVVGYCDKLCGTPSYVAPEILEATEFRRYSFPVDVWSAGVLLYICLCGFTPFSNELYTPENPYTLAQQIKMSQYTYPSPYWDDVGD
ncbi:hypothetical protein VTN00DRAFT_5803 [Thermoascus crustaceus]|uniref:uncharacterized protein n=1 Tax=Thermoascus crustaceus TaxID=5088 RepID=UPI003743C402